jgi:hypothetical protein
MSRGLAAPPTTPYPDRAMKLFFGFLLVLLLIGGGMKLAGQRLPILDYPLGGLFTQPQIQVQTNIDLP